MPPLKTTRKYTLLHFSHRTLSLFSYLFLYSGFLLLLPDATAQSTELWGQTSSYSPVDDISYFEELIFEIKDQKLRAGETYQIDVNAQNFNAIRGFQMALDYDDAQVDVLDIEEEILPEFSEANVNLAFAEQGKIPVSWHHTAGQELSSKDATLRVIIKAKADINLNKVLRITSSLTCAEAYNSMELMNIALQFNSDSSAANTDPFQLFQNQPNPFKDATTIGFVLLKDGEVTLEIFDVNGRLVHSQRSDYAKGNQHVDLDRASLLSGVL